MQNDIGKTPLHMLCSVPYSSDASVGAFSAYIACGEGRIAAFMKDNEGKTPLDHLCERGLNDMSFLMNESFGGLMVWWCDCLGIDILAEDAN